MKVESVRLTWPDWPIPDRYWKVIIQSTSTFTILEGCLCDLLPKSVEYLTTDKDGLKVIQSTWIELKVVGNWAEIGRFFRHQKKCDIAVKLVFHQLKWRRRPTSKSDVNIDGILYNNCRFILTTESCKNWSPLSQFELNPIKSDRFSD